MARTPPFAAAPRPSVGVLPGFRPALALTMVYLSLLVLLPVAALVLRTAGIGWTALLQTIASPRALAAYRLSFGGALVAAAIDSALGLLLAWVLVRYRFPGRRLIDAAVDLPLALPTAVAGIALTAVYAGTGVVGRYLEGLGIRVAFTRVGVLCAMVFVGLPFAVRTVQPVLMDMDPQTEEAAAVLGATRRQTLLRVLLPAILPAAATGFALAFARAVGEYGSIVFISGNMPMKTEIAPLLIVTKLEQYDYQGATALALVMLLGSFAILLAVNGLGAWNRRGAGSRRAHG